MSSEEYMIRVAPVLGEYTTTFAFGEKALDSASRWAMNWFKAGYDADSVVAGLREGMSGRITKKEQVGHHYAHLTEIIKQNRSHVLKNSIPQSSCDICSGGHVLVPHPKCVLDLQWNDFAHRNCYYTCAVYCNCVLGRYKYETDPVYEFHGKPTKLMTLAYYEDYVCGSWRVLMDQLPGLIEEKGKLTTALLKANRPVISESRMGPLPMMAAPLGPVVTQVVASKTRSAPQQQKPAPQKSPPPPVQQAPKTEVKGNEFF